MPEGATIDAEAGSFRNLTMVTTALVQIAASKTAISAKMIFLFVDLVICAPPLHICDYIIP